MKKIILIIIALLVLGCASANPKSSPIPTGDIVVPPRGWVEYKIRGGE